MQSTQHDAIEFDRDWDWDWDLDFYPHVKETTCLWIFEPRRRETHQAALNYKKPNQAFDLASP